VSERSVGRKSYRPWTPRQAFLLPPSPMEWLGEGHLVHFIIDVVERLDVASVEAAIAARDPRGTRPYSPRMMISLLLYGYCVGVFSSRKLARATYEDVACRVLCAGEHPHFTNINQFRLDHREAFAQLFVQVVRMCKRAGLVKLGHISTDGTKVLANASKHKAMTYERMQDEEVRLLAAINELLENADRVNREEDEKYGAGVAALDLPEELSRRENRVARIQEAMAELEREAARARATELLENAAGQWQKADDVSVDEEERGRAANRAAKSEAIAAELDPPDDDDDDKPASPDATDLPQHRPSTTPEGEPSPKAQRNFTDGDSRIMVMGGAYVQAYNAQIAVDDWSQVIVAQAVTNQAPDVQHLVPIIDRIGDALGEFPQRLSADNGYYSDANVDACTQRGIDAYIAAGRQAHGSSRDAPARPTLSPTKAAMKAKLETTDGHAIYARRKVIAEPPIGQIKGGQGFRRFSLRGLAKVRCEWALVCLTHNLLKLYRSAAPIPAMA
jgi:transposase